MAIAMSLAALTLFNVASAQPPSQTQYDLVFTVDDSIQQCGSTQIAYAVSPTFEDTVVPISLTLGLQSGSNYLALTNDAQLFNGSWNWSPVNISAGQYRLLGGAQNDQYDIHGVSSTFTISAGTDSSCLVASSPSPTPSPPIATDSTATLPQQTVSSPSSSTDLPNTSGLSSTSSTASSLSTGAKAGLGIAAAIIILAGLGALYWFFIVRRKRMGINHLSSGSSAHRPGMSTGGAGAMSRSSQHWGGLQSIDEHEPKPGQNQSFGAVPAPYPERSLTTVTTSSSSGDEKRAETPSAGALYGYNAYPPLSPAEGNGAAYLPPVTLGEAERRSKGPTTRKPVPSYTPDPDAENNRNSFIDPFASRHSSVSSSSEHLHPGYSPTTAPELHHKSSFGESVKPMHVLAVDVPPPERVSSPPIRLSGSETGRRR